MMKLCVICNSNPETTWPKRWQCWKENGKFSESLCKLLELPKYYEADFQKSAYCSKCQKKVYNIYLIVRKWDKLQEDISKLKKDLESNFHEAIGKCARKKNELGLMDTGAIVGKESKTDQGITWIINSIRSAVSEAHIRNGTLNVSETEEGKVNFLRRKILKRLSRSHDTSDWDCDCCYDPKKGEKTHQKHESHRNDKCCDECGPAHPSSEGQGGKGIKDQDRQQGQGGSESESDSNSGSDYSSGEDDDHENCTLCSSSKERERYCDDCPLCKEEEAEARNKSKKDKKKEKEDENSMKNENRYNMSLRDILTEESGDTSKSMSMPGTSGTEKRENITNRPPSSSSTSFSQGKQMESIHNNEQSPEMLYIPPTDNCMGGDVGESNLSGTGSPGMVSIHKTTNKPKPKPELTETNGNSLVKKDVSISNLFMTGGKLISDLKPINTSSPVSEDTPINYKEIRYRCYRSNCIRTFATKEELDIHIKRHHEGVKCPYECTEKNCGKSFQRSRELNAHSLKHSGQFAISCNLCGRGFRTKPLYETHLKTKHAEGARKFKCSFCDKSFITESKLKTHLTIHTKDYPFSCVVCGKGFSAKTFLNIHMSKHLDSNPYKCTVCLKTFSSPRNLRIHQYTHDQTHPFRCPECYAGMPSEATLKQHMLKHEDEKSHVCHVCNSRFQFPSSLKKHLKVHDGDMRFVCDFCNKTFIDKYKLTRHVRTHSKEKPYQCLICSKCFATKDYLNTHVKKHSRGTKRVPDSIPSSTISNASDESINSFTLSTNSQSINSSQHIPNSSTAPSSISNCQTSSFSTAPQSTILTSTTSSIYMPLPPAAPPAPASSIPTIMTLPEDDHPTQVDELTATIQLENLSSEQLLMIDNDVHSPYDSQANDLMEIPRNNLLQPSFHSNEHLDHMLHGDFSELTFQNL